MVVTVKSNHEQARNCYRRRINGLQDDKYLDRFIPSRCPTKEYGTWNYDYKIITEEDILLAPHFNGTVFCEHCYKELIGNIGIATENMIDILEDQEYGCINDNECVAKIKLLPEEITIDHLMEMGSLGGYGYDYTCEHCNVFCKMEQENKDNEEIEKWMIEEKIRKFEDREAGKTFCILVFVLVIMYLIFEYFSV